LPTPSFRMAAESETKTTDNNLYIYILYILVLSRWKKARVCTCSRYMNLISTTVSGKILGIKFVSWDTDGLINTFWLEISECTQLIVESETIAPRRENLTLKYSNIAERDKIVIKIISMILNIKICFK